VTISFPVLVLLAVLIGLVLVARGGSSGGSGAPRRWGGWGEDHVPWGGADEPFHPRDRDLRERAWEEAEAEHRRREEGARDTRMGERYGGDFAPWPPDGP
jgi:hypothetical protein